MLHYENLSLTFLSILTVFVPGTSCFAGMPSWSFFFFLNQRSKKPTSSYLVLARNTECRWSVCPRCPYSVLHVMFWHLSNRLITSISLGKSDIPHFISWLSLGWLLLMMCYFCVLTLPDSDLMAWKSGVYLVRPVSTQNFNFDARTILTGWISPPLPYVPFVALWTVHNVQCAICLIFRIFLFIIVIIDYFRNTCVSIIF